MHIHMRRGDGWSGHTDFTLTVDHGSENLGGESPAFQRYIRKVGKNLTVYKASIQVFQAAKPPETTWGDEINPPF